MQAPRLMQAAFTSLRSMAATDQMPFGPDQQWLFHEREIFQFSEGSGGN